MIRIRFIFSAIALMLLLLILTQFSRAQDQPATARRKVDTENQDIALPKAIKRLEAEYPEEAKDKRISGIVLVEFVLDKEGKVTSPRAKSGHPLLKPVALEAAKGWEFEIPMQNGQPTKLLGEMVFCFLATKDTSKSKYTFSFERCCPNKIVKPDDWCTDNK
jgi:TonB family protein